MTEQPIAHGTAEALEGAARLIREGQPDRAAWRVADAGLVLREILEAMGHKNLIGLDEPTGLHAVLPRMEPETDEEPMFYIQDTRWLQGGHQPFFRTRAGGYTGILAEAGRFTMAEAQEIINPAIHKVWPSTTVMKAARLEVNLQHLHRVADQEASHGGRI